MRKILVALFAALSFAAALAAQSEPTAMNLMKERQALTDEKKEERLSAIKRLGAWGTAASLAAPDLARMLRDDPEEEVANQAALALAKIGPLGTRELASLAQDQSTAVRQRALWALSKMGPEARDALPALQAALQDRHSLCRSYAAITLGELGADAKGAIPALCKAVSDNDAAVRAYAVAALGNIGPESLVHLRKILHDEDFGIRICGLRALALHGSDAKPAVQDLIELLADETADVRTGATLALAAIGPDAKAALPHLLETIQDDKYEVQQAAFAAVISILGDNEAALLETMTNLNEKVRWKTPYLLQQFGPTTAHTVQGLIKKLESPDAGERMSAALGLSQIGKKHGEEAIAPLEKALNDPVPQVQHAAMFALSCILAKLPGHAHQSLNRALERIVKLDDQALQDVGRLQSSFAAAPVIPKYLSRLVNRQALGDPQVQASYNTLVDIHIMISAEVNAVIGPTCEDTKIKKILPELLKPVWTVTRSALKNFAPEAAPALVRGMNQTAYYDLGFT